MPLIPGTRIGAYEVSAQIGVDGMGEVYRATDTKLGRDVAIKVLPESFATDPERLARFEREARTLAALNHPNIAAIYGLEDSGDTKALVMELVPGSTLADRIAQGVVPVEEALPVAKQIAEALEAAHEQGIIHRDLKPANVKVRQDGTVKVLDFGLAKALEPAGASPSTSQSPTITTPAMTQAGMILGTAAYMSPEQARGRNVDTRTDIWAFGCVLFEMLTGRRAFAGEDVAETIGAVIHKEPAWERLPSDLSPTFRPYLQRCLEKDPRQRVQATGDVRLALEGAFETDERPALAGGRPGWGWIAGAVVAGGLLVGIIGWAAGVGVGGSGTTLRARRFPLVIPTAEALPLASGELLTLSPDGHTLVYRAVDVDGVSRLYRRALDQIDGEPIPGTEGASNPFFSFDSEWVGFRSGASLMKVALSGARPVRITAAPGAMRGAWVLDMDGERRSAPVVATDFSERNGEVSPDGRWMAYESTASGQFEIYVRPFPAGEGGLRQVSTGGGVTPVWARDGRALFYVAGQALMAVPIDPGPVLTVGPPEMLLANMGITAGFTERNYDVAPDGERFLIVRPLEASDDVPTAPESSSFRIGRKS